VVRKPEQAWGLILLKNPKNASTRLSMNGNSTTISTAPPFVLRFSKDERKVFQQNRDSVLIIIRFQDEPNYGRVEAWEDHGGSTGEQ
jgi:hypothetical protein